MPLLLFLVASPVSGAQPAVEIRAEVGFSGWIVANVWTPIRVDVTSEGALDGVLEVSVGPAVYRRPVQMAPLSRQRMSLSAVISDPRRPLTVSVRDRRGVIVAQQRVPVPRDHFVSGVVMALTAEAAGLEFLLGDPRRLAGAYLQEDSLPDHWAAYEGVDLVVLRDVDERAMSGPQRLALQEWVAQGGRLLVTGERLLRQRQSWLLDLLPADVISHGAPATVGALPGLAAPQPIAVLQTRPGATRSPQTGLPLIVSRPYGRGLVTAWAFDAFAPSVRAWSGRTALWNQVLPAGRPQPIARPSLTEVMPTARTLSGMAQTQIIVLAILYVLGVRFVLRRFTSRPGGWLVLGAVVLLFAAALYAAAAASRRAAAAVVQLSVLELLGAQDLARVTTYIAVLQPYGGSYVLTTPEGSLLRPLTPRSLTAPAANMVSGDAAPGVVFFEAVQITSLPLTGRASETAAGLDLDLDNRTALTIGSPVVFLNGQTQPLPDVFGRLSTVLAPGAWMPADRNAATGDFARDARAWMTARVDAYAAPAIIGYKTLWLLGEVRDPRLPVQLQGAGEQRRLDLLLSPIPVTGGR